MPYTASRVNVVPCLIFFLNDGNIWNTGEKVGGRLPSWVLVVVVCLVEKGFVICAGSSTVDDSTTRNHNTEENIVGHEILSVAVTGNHAI